MTPPYQRDFLLGTGDRARMQGFHALRLLARTLEHEGARKIRLDDNVLSFSGLALAGVHTRISGYSGARVWVTEKDGNVRLCFRLNCLSHVIPCTLGLALLAVCMANTGFALPLALTFLTISALGVWGYSLFVTGGFRIFVEQHIKAAGVKTQSIDVQPTAEERLGVPRTEHQAS